MQVKVPEVNRCCFCCPLRWGIILFGYINLLSSMAAVGCLIIKTDPMKSMIWNNATLESVTSTVLFEILGMGVILNILLLVAGYEKDVMMLRLYNFYALVTTLAALVPAIILVSQLQFIEGFASIIAISIQCYVIILVRSEIVKLEEKTTRPNDDNVVTAEVAIDVSDRDSLIQ